MKEVVEVRVGDGVASLGPVEDWLPAGGKQGVDAAARKLAPLEVHRNGECDAPRPVTGPNLAQSAVNEVDIVLLCDGAAVGRPGAVTDNASIEL